MRDNSGALGARWGELVAGPMQTAIVVSGTRAPRPHAGAAARGYRLERHPCAAMHAPAHAATPTQINYMFDLPYLLSVCPDLARADQVGLHAPRSHAGCLPRARMMGARCPAARAATFRLVMPTPR